MSISTRARLLGAAGAIFLLGVGAYALHSYSAGFYSRMLASEHITEHVMVNGKPYDVVEGFIQNDTSELSSPQRASVVRLAYEKAVARRSPRIALAGTDPVNLRKAVTHLQGTAVLLSDLQTDTGRAELVRTALYPIRFLSSAADLEAARLRFLESGSDVDAKRYRLLAVETAEAFQSDLAAFEAAFETVVQKSAPPYVMVRNYNDFTTTTGIVSELSAGMRATVHALAQRERCFDGFAYACDGSDISLPLPASVAPLPEISAEQRSYVRAKFNRPPLSLKLAEMNLSSVPLLQISDPGCVPEGSEPQLYVLRSTRVDDMSYLNPVMLTADRLVDVRTQKDIPFFKFFVDRGVSYITSSPFVYYECVNQARDTAVLFGMHAAITAAAKDTDTPNELTTRLRSVADPITESETNAYARDRASHGETELALSIKNMSTGYDSQLLNISAMERTNARLLREGLAVGLKATDLFYTRSALPALFMTDNPSVTGAHPELYPPAPEVPEPYVHYRDLSDAEKARADAGQRYYFLLHNDPAFATQELHR